MKKENTQISIAKKKKQTRIMCYVGLVFLSILLFLPVALRIFVKEEPTDEPKSNVVVVLNCNKVDESISSSFLNDEPQNISYTLKGDYTIVSNPDEEISSSEINASSETQSNPTPTPFVDNSKLVDVRDESLLEILRPYSSITYDPSDNTTSIRTNVSYLRNNSEYKSYFDNINTQLSYFTSQGFTCVQLQT